jgi:electron transport complex protein RnfA
MSQLITIFVAAFLINNITLMRFLALCSYMGMTSDVSQSVGMGLAVTFVTVIASAVTWPIYYWLLKPLNLQFLQILVFIIVIAALVQLVEYYLKKSVPTLYRAMGIYLPLITTNCAILAVTFDQITKNYNFVQSIVFALAVSLGYLLAMVLLAGVRQRLRNSPIPSFMMDTPILFVTTSIIAVAFMGFAGLVRTP